MKVSTLLSLTALTAVTVMGIDAKAQLNIPSASQCYNNATTPAEQAHCDALQACIDNNSDDQASLSGCMDEAEDALVAKTIEIEQEAIGTPTAEMAYENVPQQVTQSETIRTNTLKANSDLVESIQGEKGFTQQQEGPNTPFNPAA